MGALSRACVDQALEGRTKAVALSADWRFDAAEVLHLVDRETARTGAAIPETLSRQYRLLKHRERCSLHLADRLLCEMLGRPDLFQQLREEPGWRPAVSAETIGL